MLEKNDNQQKPTIPGRIKRTLKFSLFFLYLGLLVLAFYEYYGLRQEREKYRIARNYLCVLRMLNFDEGDEFQLLPGTNFRTYINDDRTSANISLIDGATIRMKDFGNGRFVGYRHSDGCFYVAKPVAGDYVLRRQNVSKMPIQKFMDIIKDPAYADTATPTNKQTEQ